MTLFITVLVCVIGQPCDTQHARAFRSYISDGAVCGSAPMQMVAGSDVLAPGDGEFIQVKCSVRR